MKAISIVPLMCLFINLLLLIFTYVKTPYCNEFLGLNLLYLFFFTTIIQATLLFFKKKKPVSIIALIICLLNICAFIYYVKNFSYCW